MESQFCSNFTWPEGERGKNSYSKILVCTGFGLIVPTGIRQGKLGASIAGRALTPEEGQQLQGLSAKLEKLTRINFTLVATALATMVIARYL